ncbi:epimerase [Flavobacterium sp. Sd200]|uniref:epimerase n=1 Tax=Flavobacterium sp. Sd200 TaxID=2692211 RepID=UPI001927A897|nr:epimerase [Flavobacterium sp. Sd200]
MKIIHTGATGLVGEGVLFACFEHPEVEEILIITRKPYTGVKHSKLRELIVPDFMDIEQYKDNLDGYDACFYCAGISSLGMGETEYTQITYTTTLNFAKVLVDINPQMIFCHISGANTDGTEKKGAMWARVKGKTENALMQLPFKRVYNFRPAFMKPYKGQQNVKGYYKTISFLSPLFKFLMPHMTSTMQQVGFSMINSVSKVYEKQILEVEDINKLAKL